MPEIRVLEIEAFIAANKRFVGPDNLVDPLGLQSAVSRQSAGYGETHIYPTIAAKAGALLHGIIQNHPFIDGNKRTALWAAAVLAGANGFELDGTADD